MCEPVRFTTPFYQMPTQSRIDACTSICFDLKLLDYTVCVVSTVLHLLYLFAKVSVMISTDIAMSL